MRRRTTVGSGRRRMVIPANVAGFRNKLFKKTSKETLKKPTLTRKHLQERVMRQMISGLVAAVAVMAAAPAILMPESKPAS